MTTDTAKRSSPAFRIRTSGMATLSQLYELHQLLTRHLIRDLSKDTASAETLSTARQFLAHQHVTAEPSDERRLRRLYRAYIGQLERGMAAENPSTSFLGEVRLCLKANGISKNVEATLGERRALAVLNFDDLPFKTDGSENYH